ncbi:MAG TPA: hypothetical protein VF575_04035 [Candidatus Saccharimonadales bacterium]|jgi:hypothetical protein
MKTSNSETLTPTLFLPLTDPANKLTNLELFYARDPEVIQSDVTASSLVSSGSADNFAGDITCPDDMERLHTPQLRIPFAAANPNISQTPSSSNRRRLVCTALATALFAGISVSNASSAEAAERRLKPGQTVKSAIGNLRAGDTLRLPRGPHYIGGMVVRMHPGTAKKPIRITALDPRNKPILVGNTTLYDSKYTQIDNLKLLGTRKNSVTLTIGGGNHITVRNNEITGANKTGADANLSISTSKYGPKRPASNWKVLDNCIHDAAKGSIDRKHNIYVNEGSPRTGQSLKGLISGNIIFHAFAGAGIKVGFGAPYTERNGVVVPNKTPSASGITIVNNTISEVKRGIMFSGETRHNIVMRNLVVRALDKNISAAIYMNYITTDVKDGSVAKVAANYAYGVDTVVATPPPQKPVKIPMSEYLKKFRIDNKTNIKATSNPGLRVNCSGAVANVKVRQTYGALAKHPR